MTAGGQVGSWAGGGVTFMTAGGQVLDSYTPCLNNSKEHSRHRRRLWGGTGRPALRQAMYGNCHEEEQQ